MLKVRLIFPFSLFFPPSRLVLHQTLYLSMEEPGLTICIPQKRKRITRYYAKYFALYYCFIGHLNSNYRFLKVISIFLSVDIGIWHWVPLMPWKRLLEYVNYGNNFLYIKLIMLLKRFKRRCRWALLMLEWIKNMLISAFKTEQM